MLPSALLKLPSDEFMINMGVGLRADRMDYENGQGEYWWISILKAFGFKMQDPNELPPDGVTWM
ncbi:hypothetical protein [Deinococcus cellulosilyticus]|uniref:Uncharacterized protein n=1 Tax=Deinococcus cellulosilyticus (strain DSM 18568 / NBRC 106333 / KACC 11606 / 5516J-15) TaxID=1223518 RepID=A0A511N461_DEIC1|nr:hypothetical protein [Deinococcus cellulosilyticus]GEM47216.1 hypothetical protein DC3_28510 [Deinococcus cellulosilyticus NBRC 106333 = KACC 11606]